METTNPFNVTFGIKSKNYISRIKTFDSIIDYFKNSQEFGSAYLITGLRGCGKTAMLSKIEEYFSNEKNWIVIELIPSIDMLEQFASRLYDKCKSLNMLLKSTFSFSFTGFTFSIEGKEKVTNIVTLIEKLLEAMNQKKYKILVCIDEAIKTDNVISFTQTYQYLIRKQFPVFLLMTGLYKNISDIQNDKALTFFLRTPKVFLEPLNMYLISTKYKEIFKIDEEVSKNLASLTNGYAFCYQLLGKILWEHKKTDISDEILDELDQTLYEYVYEKIWNDLSDIDRKILSVFKENKVYEANEIIDILEIDKKLYSLYRDRLIKRGYLSPCGYGKVKLTLPRLITIVNKYSF